MEIPSQEPQDAGRLKKKRQALDALFYERYLYGSSERQEVALLLDEAWNFIRASSPAFRQDVMVQHAEKILPLLPELGDKLSWSLPIDLLEHSTREDLRSLLSLLIHTMPIHQQKEELGNFIAALHKDGKEFHHILKGKKYHSKPKLALKCEAPTLYNLVGTYLLKLEVKTEKPDKDLLHFAWEYLSHASQLAKEGYTALPLKEQTPERDFETRQLVLTALLQMCYINLHLRENTSGVMQTDLLWGIHDELRSYIAMVDQKVARASVPFKTKLSTLHRTLKEKYSHIEFLRSLVQPPKAEVEVEVDEEEVSTLGLLEDARQALLRIDSPDYPCKKDDRIRAEDCLYPILCRLTKDLMQEVADLDEEADPA